MNFRPRPLVASAALAAAAALPTSDAEACGGCFTPSTETQSTVVTGHRMAFAISTTQSVLWDQIQYAGSPSDFAWVLPVKGGAVIQASNDAWFETLDAATAAQIVSPPINCGSPSSGGGCNIGCGSSAATALEAGGDFGGSAPPPVTVTHEGTVGPYETVTLHANVPNALPSWLTAHNYNIDPTVSPIIDAYTGEGFDFIALRLLPGAGIRQMKPVRVVTPGASPSLPLRMVAAGTGANVAITLFVIGEGRWEPQNFPTGALNQNTLTWDFTTQSSDYATQRVALLATHGGLTWNNAFANQGSLLSQDVVNGQSTFITVGTSLASTVAQAYALQGASDQQAEDPGSAPIDISGCFNTYATSNAQVVACGAASGTGGSGPASGTGGSDAGSGTGGGSSGASCSELSANQIPASVFACGPLDDIATALIGMHPASVWLTRLEANLPHAGLATDLTLQASSQQVAVSNIFTLTRSTGDPCGTSPIDAGAGTLRMTRGVWIRNQLVLYGTILAAVAAAVGRRRHRPSAALARPRVG